MCADIRGCIDSHSDICIQITDAQEKNESESGSNSGAGFIVECRIININNKAYADGAYRNSGCTIRHTPFVRHRRKWGRRCLTPLGEICEKPVKTGEMGTEVPDPFLQAKW